MRSGRTASTVRIRCEAGSGCNEVPCYHPLHGWKSAEVTKNGKRKLTFNPKYGFIDLPVEVPCGQCVGCRLERSRQWAVRCVHEASLHLDNCFITLTYDPSRVPEGGTLVKKHFQDFMKRLRKRSGVRIRFFHCGEYGEDLQRPHYHALLFGYDFPDKKFHTRNAQGNTVFKSDLLEELWGHGFCTVGAFTFETAAYCARYVMKKVTGELAADHYRHVDPETGEIFERLPEYVTMSLKPGIGSEWYSRFKSDVFPDDFVVVRGARQGVPLFYLRRLEKEDLTCYSKLKRRRLERQFVHRDNCTPERLKVRETVRNAQISTLKRTI